MPRRQKIFIAAILSALLVGCTTASPASQPNEAVRQAEEIARLTRENQDLKDMLRAVQTKLDEIQRQPARVLPTPSYISREEAIGIAQKSAPNLKPINARLFHLGDVSFWMVDFEYPNFAFSVIIDAITGRNLVSPNPPMNEPKS